MKIDEGKRKEDEKGKEREEKKRKERKISKEIGQERK